MDIYISFTNWREGDVPGATVQEHTPLTAATNVAEPPQGRIWEGGHQDLAGQDSVSTEMFEQAEWSALEGWLGKARSGTTRLKEWVIHSQPSRRGTARRGRPLYTCSAGIIQVITPL